MLSTSAEKFERSSSITSAATLRRSVRPKIDTHPEPPALLRRIPFFCVDRSAASARRLLDVRRALGSAPSSAVVRAAACSAARARSTLDSSSMSARASASTICDDTRCGGSCLQAGGAPISLRSASL